MSMSGFCEGYCRIATMESDRARAIEPDERSGVLRPDNLGRFSAEWIAPASDVSEVVDTYWTVSWNLDADESIEQRIIDHPSVTLSIERGAVPAPFVVTSSRSTSWIRTITGHGDVFAVRLRPAGLAVVSDMAAPSLTGEQPVTPSLDSRAHRFLQQIAAEPEPAARARTADALVRGLLTDRPLTPRQRLANAAFDELVRSPQVRRIDDLATTMRVNVRTLQRALSLTIGRSPGEVARRVRLQEVVRRLSTGQDDIAVIAAELGYVDQAHLTHDFRSATDVTPGVYMADLVSTQNALTRRPEHG